MRTKIGDMFYLVYHSFDGTLFFEGVVKRTNTNIVDVLQAKDGTKKHHNNFLFSHRMETNKGVQITILTKEEYPEYFI
jgi:hypothetical protein